MASAEPNPARFPKKIPDFFIRFLTNPGDIVLDIFAGSNTTGEAAEDNQRRWIAFEVERKYVAGSALRFIDTTSEEEIKIFYDRLLDSSTFEIDINEGKGTLVEPNLPIIGQIEETSAQTSI
jgi:site-specific DNA-methyltransferase (cytosine-N4-specific)